MKQSTSKVILLGVLALLFAVMAFATTIAVKHHRYYVALDKQRNKEFVISGENAAKLLRPAAMITVDSHFMLVSAKGKLIVYCIADNKCIYGAGVTRQTLATAITQLFDDLARQNREMRAAQQKAATANVSGSNAGSAAIVGHTVNNYGADGHSVRNRPNSSPDTRSHKPANTGGHSEILQESHGANSPNISNVQGPVDIR